MIEDFLMIEIINNILAIDYIDIKEFNAKKLIRKLSHFVNVDSEKVIYSMCRDGDNDSLWVIAAIKYYTDDEINSIITFMLETDIYLEYYMGDM